MARSKSRSPGSSLRSERTASEYCARLVRRYQAKGKAAARELLATAKALEASDLANRLELCRRLVEAVSPAHLQLKSLRQFSSLRVGESFRMAMVSQNAIRRAFLLERAKSSPQSILEKKDVGQAFAASLRLRLPAVFQSKVSHSEIEWRNHCVIKPTASAASNGVFLLNGSKTFLDLKSHEIFGDKDELRRRIKKCLKTGHVAPDSWQVEELILGKDGRWPPLDVKFYSFYGRVALAVEIQRFPTLRYNWYDASGRSVVTGKYKNLQFDGAGFTHAELESAARVSLQIPLPFMRIDFLRSASGLVFGEFTPEPGKFEKFDTETDVALGHEYNRAAARLQDDLLAGKRFAAFTRLL
jgi:TupA-like ATPgrasp